MLVTICMAAVLTIGGVSAKGDAKLDQEKVDKTVYDQHVRTKQREDDRRWNMLEKMDEKLDEALKK